ncbi:hypothetical protein LSCM1_07366 [Leishmania martiniquensis]|uniref:Uncharacterized protein n=1 Tax=Leishmania martiniquensis TaxID=1580590 RepID=A0A836KT17_9TRYP|nr:hypothetical protein LSCM1_07366 [Leishmania martiniquensis]
MHCKRSLHPTLTHQFDVTWPWPGLERKGQPRAYSVASAAEGAVDSSTTQQDSIFKEEEDEGEEGTPAAPMPDRDAFTAADRSASPLWRDRRRYGWPTSILDLSGDPFLGQHETRRASMLLSPGYRCLLPLVELSEPEQLQDRAGAAFWRTAFKPPLHRAQSFESTSSLSAARSPPQCAELVIGELSGIELAVRERHEMATTSSRYHGHPFVKPPFLSGTSLGPRPVAESTPVSAGGGARLATESPDIGSQGATREETVPAPGHGQREPLTVLTFFFYTIPFRIRWLSQVAGRIVVSLPCEERLLTLHAPHGSRDYGGAPYQSLSSAPAAGSTSRSAIIAMSQVHSYTLPRGVVPLDISEVFDRPFLAVGTAEHGVLLCHLDPSTGVIQGIARWISLRGYGSSLYPVTRLAAVFPARRPAPATDRSPSFTSPPSWVRRAHTLESLNDGVLVCSSPYEPTAAVVKLGAAAEGVVEDFPVIRGVDTVLDVSAAVQPDLGPLVCTVSRKLLRLRVIESPTEEAERRTALLMKRLEGGLADRAPPCLTYDRMARLECPLLHVAASPAVLQSFTEKYVSRRSYTKHWQFVVDGANRVVLLDRTVSQYTLHSTFQLYRCGWGARAGREAPAGSFVPASPTASSGSGGRGTPPCESKRACAPGKGDEAPADDSHDSTWLSSPSPARLSPTTADRQKRPRSRPTISKGKGASGLTAKRRRSSAALSAPVKTEGDDDDDGDASPGKLPSLSAFASAVPIEDACSGVVVTCARDQTMQVAAAHDRYYISLVTWHMGPSTSAHPPSTPSSAAVATTAALAGHTEAHAGPS